MLPRSRQRSTLASARSRLCGTWPHWRGLLVVKDVALAGSWRLFTTWTACWRRRGREQGSETRPQMLSHTFVDNHNNQTVLGGFDCYRESGVGAAPTTTSRAYLAIARMSPLPNVRRL